MSAVVKIKKGDTVMVISGKDKGKSGKVLAAERAACRLVVEGVNIHIRHTRPRQQGKKGERVRFAMPIHASNALVVCPHCKKPTRITMRIIREGNIKKVRICKKCKSEL